MKKKIQFVVCGIVLGAMLLAACASGSVQPAASHPAPGASAALPSVTQVSTQPPAATAAPAPTTATSPTGAPTGTLTLAPSPSASPSPAPSATPRPTLAADEWKKLPVVPVVSEKMRAVYQKGLEKGNKPNVFAKVGDCQNVPSYFLGVFEKPGEFRLGEYAGLQPVINQFNGSFSRKSVAVSGGFNVASVLSPLHADRSVCSANETPLACELRIMRPSIVFVSMETWWSQRPADQYGAYLRQILDGILAAGAVPIVATKADNLEGDYGINAEIAKIANEYDVPLWNFWLAVQPLPHHGLSSDGFHLTNDVNYFDDVNAMQSAWPVRNLTALQALEAVWKSVQ